MSDIRHLVSVVLTYFPSVRAKDKETGEVVAVKRMRREPEKEDISHYALRETGLLLSIKHQNIISLKEVVIGGNLTDLFLVMEFCEHDIQELLDCKKTPFSVSEVKCIMVQLLQGLHFLHSNFIVHRDLKLQNLFITDEGILKIGDFGLARKYSIPLKSMSPEVVTLWYRAPELLLRAPDQTTAIDMWSVSIFKHCA